MPFTFENFFNLKKENLRGEIKKGFQRLQPDLNCNFGKINKFQLTILRFYTLNRGEGGAHTKNDALLSPILRLLSLRVVRN